MFVHTPDRLLVGWEQAVEDLLEGEAGGPQPAKGDVQGESKLLGSGDGSGGSSEGKVPNAEGVAPGGDAPQRSSSALTASAQSTDEPAAQPAAFFAPSSFPPAGSFPPGLLPQAAGGGDSGELRPTSLFARLRSGHSMLDEPAAAAAGGGAHGSASAGTSPRGGAAPNPPGSGNGRPPRPPAFSLGTASSSGLTAGAGAAAAAAAAPFLGRSRTPDPPPLQVSGHHHLR